LNEKGRILDAAFFTCAPSMGANEKAPPPEARGATIRHIANSDKDQKDWREFPL
jgi:hypothetical protein